MDSAPAAAGAKDDWESCKDMGNEAFKNGRYREAVDKYTQAIEAKDTEAVLFSNRSAAYLKLGLFAEAARDGERAVAIDPAYLKAYTRLHGALCNLGKFTEAARALTKGLAANPGAPKDDAANLRRLQREAEAAAKAVAEARELMEEHRLQDAARRLTEPFRHFPECPLVAFLYAEARVAGSPDEVHNMLTRFAGAHASDPYYLYLRGLAFYYKGQDTFKSAHTVLRQALELDPDNTKARVLLKKIRSVEAKKESGNTAFKERRFKEAVEAYTEAVECDPSNVRMNATLRANRAAAKMDLKDYQGALQDCTFAISNGCDGAKIYARRCRIYEKLDQYEDALRDMQQAYERDSSFEAELRQVKIREKRSRRKDYYKILGLSDRESDANEIKRAYKRGCLQWHPDKWAHTSDEERANAEKQFKEVGEAYGVLSDANKKRLYDSGQIDNDVEGASAAGGGGGYAASNEDMVNMMNMMFGGGFGGGFAPRRGRGRGRGTPQGFYQF